MAEKPELRSLFDRANQIETWGELPYFFSSSVWPRFIDILLKDGRAEERQLRSLLAAAGDEQDVATLMLRYAWEYKLIRQDGGFWVEGDPRKVA